MAGGKKKQRRLAPRQSTQTIPYRENHATEAGSGSSPAIDEAPPRDPALDSDEEACNDVDTKSPVWRHFIRLASNDRHPKGAIRCKLCTELKFANQHLSYQGTSTGHLFTHLRTKHKTAFDSLRPAESSTPDQPSIKSAVRHRNKTFSVERFWQCILRWIVMSSVAFNEVENPYLQEAFYLCHDEAKLPSADTVRNMIEKTYSEMQPRVRAMLDAAPGKFAFTTDEWTSPNTYAFKGITCHFIDSQWRLRHILLGFEPLEGSHDHENLHAVFTGVLADSTWVIPMTRIQSITYDNHTVNNSFMQKLAAENGLDYGRGYRCLAHVINLAAQAFMKCAVCDAVAEKVRAIATYVTRSASAQRMEQWRKMCGKVLQVDMKVRWSSTHDMLRDAVRLKDKIKEWMLGIEPDWQATLELTVNDWASIQQLLSLLAPLAQATNVATKQDQPCSVVLPLYNLCYYKYKEYYGKAEYSAYKPALKAALLVFHKYYDFTTHSLSAASVLDPRVKFEHFRKYSTCAGHESVSEAEMHVREELSTYLEVGEDEGQASQASRSLPVADDDLLHELFSVADVTPCQGDEFVQYNEEPKESIDSDPLMWWKKNEKKYPKLARAARDYLAGRSTSADSERAFSKARQTISEFRHRLGPETIKKCMLLKSWIKDFDNYGDAVTYGSCITE